MLSLIVLHLLAIAFYRVRGRRLIMPMVTGRDDQLASEISETTGGGAIRALLAAGAAILFGWWISAGAPY